MANRSFRSWQSMQDFSGNEKSESGEISSEKRDLAQQNETPSVLTINISGIGLTPQPASRLTVGLTPRGRSQSLS